jgi:hypothetical protein
MTLPAGGWAAEWRRFAEGHLPGGWPESWAEGPPEGAPVDPPGELGEATRRQWRDRRGRWIDMPDVFAPPAERNWLGERQRMSGIHRRGMPPTPLSMLVATGEPDMQRFGAPALGRLMVPDSWDPGTRAERDGVPFAADNGGFWGVDEAKYKAMCEAIAKAGSHPLWVTVPDVLLHPADGPPVGDWRRTAERFGQCGRRGRRRWGGGRGRVLRGR